MSPAINEIEVSSKQVSTGFMQAHKFGFLSRHAEISNCHIDNTKLLFK